ncbi:MAG: ABC transporter ATP-binding protein [Actinomyces sp.]|nr:ABC transporter ATP-binding protein [Actinomyces sp.]
MNRKHVVIAVSWMSALALAGVYICSGYVIDAVIESRPLSWGLWAVAAICAVVTGVSAWAASRLAGHSVGAIEKEYRHRIVDHVFARGPAERSRERTGRIVNSATDGVERVANYRGTFIGPMIASLATPILIVVVIAIAIDWVAALILALAIPIVPLAIGAFRAAFKPVSSRYRSAARSLAAAELDAIQGLSALTLMNAGAAMGRHLADQSEKVRRRVMRYLAANQLVLFVMDAVFSLGIITGAALLGTWRAGSGAISVGQAIALVLLSTIMLDPLDRVGQFFYVGMGGMASQREIKRLTSEPVAVSDAADAIDPDAHGVAQRGAGDAVRRGAGDVTRGSDSEEISGSTGGASGATIDIDRVNFAYQEGVNVLTDASLHIGAGQHVVLTGPSGAGKTTLATLICANRRPDSGSIRINGHDLTDVTLQWIRRHITTVEQETYLFTGTLRDNLLIANPHATDQDLRRALDAARLTQTLERLPYGLDTEVGERGLALSGGEAQRVAIARALLKDAPILILDEPTAHVDLNSEHEILQALAHLTQGRTTLTISHRRNTIDQSGRRITMRDGQLTDGKAASR